MREIKFRLIKNGKIVGFERHILTKDYEDPPGIINIEHSKNGKAWFRINNQIFDDDKEDTFLQSIIHDDKEQYTGLKTKDSTENEIYEGDIEEGGWTVFFNNGQFYCGDPEGGWEADLHDIENVCYNKKRDESYYNGKIIGNIHEDKD